MAGGFGNNILGGQAFAQQGEFNFIPQNNVSPNRNRVQPGFHQPGRRGYLRPVPFIPRVISEEGEDLGISIQSVSGALVGKIRTDVQFSIVHEMRFTLDDNGCADFSMKLLELPEFPILPFSTIIINIGNTPFDWYRGIIDYPDSEANGQRDLFEFRGLGFKQYLNDLSGQDLTFTLGQDIGEIVDNLVQNRVAPESPINYNPIKINTLTGRINANPIQLSKQGLKKVFETFADMTLHRYGVDGDGDFFFLPRDDDQTIQKTFFVGYDMESFKPKINLQEVRNAISVLRQEGKATGGAGWKLGGLFNDYSSAAKYKTRKLDYQVPGYFDDEEVEIIGNALLEQKKEPKVSASAEGIEIRNASDFLPPGFYRFVLPYGLYSEIFSDVDDETEWKKFGAGDLAVSKGEDFFIHGDGALQLDYADAYQDRVELTQNFRGNIQAIRFYVRANRAGSYMTLGVGLTNWDENTTTVDVVSTQVYQPIEWDVSSLDIKEINKLALRIDEVPATGGGIPNRIYVDRIEFKVKGHKTYRLELAKRTYKFNGRDQSTSIELGELPPRMENYLAGLFANASELRFMQEKV